MPEADGVARAMDAVQRFFDETDEYDKALSEQAKVSYEWMLLWWGLSGCRAAGPWEVSQTEVGLAVEHFGYSFFGLFGFKGKRWRAGYSLYWQWHAQLKERNKALRQAARDLLAWHDQLTGLVAQLKVYFMARRGSTDEEPEDDYIKLLQDFAEWKTYFENKIDKLAREYEGMLKDPVDPNR